MTPQSVANESVAEPSDGSRPEGSPPRSGVYRDASRHELSLIRFPEEDTDWVVIMRAHLDEGSRALTAELSPRLEALTDLIPLVGARLNAETWSYGAPNSPTETTGDPLRHVDAWRAFDLAREAPLRLVVSDNGQLGIAAHHAAFDGLAMVALLQFLLGGPAPEPAVSPPAGPSDGNLPYIKRILQPARAVAGSVRRPAIDTILARPVKISGRRTTGRLAASCVAAAGAHNRRAGQPFDRIGITIAVGGPAGVDNVAGYRRIDVVPSDPIVELVVEAIATVEEPQLQTKSSRYLKLTAPLVPRLADSLLISNLGRHPIEHVDRLDFWPVSRGRSGLTFGLCSVEGGESSLGLRSYRHDVADGQRILDEAVERFEATV